MCLTEFNKEEFLSCLEKEKQFKVLRLEVTTSIMYDNQGEFRDSVDEVTLFVKADTSVPFDVNQMPAGFFLETINWKEGILVFNAWGSAVREYVEDCMETEEEQEEDF